jgi:hypothetical protein
VGSEELGVRSEEWVIPYSLFLGVKIMLDINDGI